jgi:hypothetical protein
MGKKLKDYTDHNISVFLEKPYFTWYKKKRKPQLAIAL